MKLKVIRIACLLLSMCILASCGGGNSSSSSMQPETKTYTNPIYNVDFPDPSIIRDDDGYYYAFGTTGTHDWGGDIGYKFLGVPIIKSKNLVDWTCIGGVFPTKAQMPTWGTAGASVWGPDIVKIGDKYLCYYGLSKWGDEDPGIGVATASSLSGPWTDQGKIFKSSEIGVPNSIDPCVFQDDDGKIYLYWGSFTGTFVIELESDGLKVKEGASKQLVAGYASRNWDGGLYEATYVRKIDDLYYMFLSTGTCCDGFNSTYHVVCAIGESAVGPFYDENDKLMTGYENRGAGTLVVEGSDEFVGTGHISLAQDDAGDYYMFFHAYNKKGSNSERVLMMQKLILDDGYAHLENRKPKSVCDKPFIKK